MKFTERTELLTLKIGVIAATVLAVLALCVLLYAVGGYLWVQFQGHTATLVDAPDPPTWESMREPLLGVSASDLEVAGNTGDQESLELGAFAPEFVEILEQFDSLYGLSGRKESSFSDQYPLSVVSQFLINNSKVPEEFHAEAVAGLLTLARDMAADQRLARIYDSNSRTEVISESLRKYARIYAVSAQDHLAKLELRKLEASQASAAGTRRAIDIGTMAIAIALGSLLILVLIRIESHLRDVPPRA